MTTGNEGSPSVTVTLTPAAAEKVKKELEGLGGEPDRRGLRVQALPGGCSGFRYSLDLERAPLADDVVVVSEGVRLFVDAFSAQYLNGLTIGYRSSLQEEGFTFENPNASGGCGCGSSFSV